MRKPFTPGEAAGIYQELKTLCAEDAARRQHAGLPGTANLASQAPGRLEPRAHAALLVTGSLSYTTLERVSELQRLAADPATPEALREIVRAALVDIDRDGKVYGHYRRVKQVEADLAPRPVAAPEQSAVVRGFVEGLDRLRDWARAYDPAEIGPALQPQTMRRPPAAARRPPGLRPRRPQHPPALTDAALAGGVGAAMRTYRVPITNSSGGLRCELAPQHLPRPTSRPCSTSSRPPTGSG